MHKGVDGVATFRVSKDKNYTTINNTGLKDKRLTWKAKGILAYILSLPDDWVFYMEEVAEHAKDKLDSLKSGMKELKEYGYVKRYPVKDEKGKITRWETIIYEVPQGEKPLVENPQMENPLVGEPPVENPLLLSTYIPSTNLTNDDVDKHPLIDEEFQKSYNYLLQNNIPLSETAMQDLGEFSDVLGSQIIMEAVDRAVDQNAKRWKYISGILFNWQKSNVKTMADVIKLDEDYKNQRGGVGNATRRGRTGKGYGTSRSYEEENASRERNMPSFIKRV